MRNRGDDETLSLNRHPVLFPEDNLNFVRLNRLSRPCYAYVYVVRCLCSEKLEDLTFNSN